MVVPAPHLFAGRCAAAESKVGVFHGHTDTGATAVGAGVTIGAFFFGVWEYGEAPFVFHLYMDSISSGDLFRTCKKKKKILGCTKSNQYGFAVCDRGLGVIHFHFSFGNTILVVF